MQEDCNDNVWPWLLSKGAQLGCGTCKFISEALKCCLFFEASCHEMHVNGNAWQSSPDHCRISESVTLSQGNSSLVAHALATAITSASAAGYSRVVGQAIAQALTGGDPSQAQCFSAALSIAVDSGGCSSIAEAFAGELEHPCSSCFKPILQEYSTLQTWEITCKHTSAHTCNMYLTPYTIISRLCQNS